MHEWESLIDQNSVKGVIFKLDFHQVFRVWPHPVIIYNINLV